MTTNEWRIQDVPARVAAGAAYLDAFAPGWANKVNLPSFDIRSPYECVLAQVFGEGEDEETDTTENGFEQGRHVLMIPYEVCDALGFDAHSYETDKGHHYTSPEPEYAALQAEWERVINERSN